MKNKKRHFITVLAFLSLFSVQLGLTLALLLAPTSVYAVLCEPMDNTSDGDECNGKEGLGDACSNDSTAKSDEGTYCGNPINITTGNKYQREIDYIGSGPFPLKIVRHFNSMSRTNMEGDFQFSSNWRFNVQAEIRIISANSTVYAVRGDQKAFLFSKSNGQWVAKGNINSKLKETNSGWEYTTGDDEVELYDTAGKLLSVTNRAGLTQTYAYDYTKNVNGNLSSVTDPFGRKLLFTFKKVAFTWVIESITDKSTDGVYKYIYNSNTHIESVTYPDNTSKIYLYSNLHNKALVGYNELIGIIDENNAVLNTNKEPVFNDNTVRFARWTYDTTNGKALSSEHAGGVDKVTISYNLDDIANRRNSVTDALRRISQYTYYDFTDSSLLRTKDATLPTGSTSHRTYDSNGNLSSYTDHNGIQTTYQYDNLNRNLETKRIEAVGTPQERTIETEWHPTLRLPTKITESNRVTTLGYDSKGNLLQRTITPTNCTAPNCIARTWTYTYNTNSQLASVNGPLPDDLLTGTQDVTRYDYDAQGNLIKITNKITDALEHVTQITSYDASGRPLTIIDPNGLITQLTYDGRGRLQSRTVGNGSIDDEKTTYAYDNVGQVSKITAPSGGYTTFTYDNAHRLIGISDDVGNKIVYTLDAMSNRTKEAVYDPNNALATTRSHEFDALNRLSALIGAQNQTTQFGYDDNNNLTAITDPLLRHTTNVYDPFNRLISSTDADASSNHAQTQYSYNANDKLTDVTDANNLHTQYSVTGLGDVTQIVSPDTGTSTKTYDAAGNVLSSTDARGKTTSYSYDVLNRLTGISYADASSVSFSYDNATNAIGRLTSISDKNNVGDETSNTAWSYDLHGRVTSKTQLIGSVSLTTSYSYDMAGRLATMIYPSGKTLTFSYDKNRLLAINQGTTPLLSNLQYTAFGAIKGWTWGNGRSYQRNFDTDGRLTRYPLGNNTFKLSYDDAGQIVGYSSANRKLNQQFNYDELGRLTDVYASQKQRLVYDPVGNRVTHNKDGAVFNYSYQAGSNRLSSVTNKTDGSYSYDLAGNVINDNVHQFTYDARGRLVKVTDLNMVDVASYSINGLGQRVSKTVDAATTLFVYDDAGHLIGEYDGSGAAVFETVYLGDTPVSVLSPAATYYVFADHLNAPRVMTTTARTVVWQWLSEPFGTTPALGLTYNLRFPGQYYDAETGLHYNYFRDYEPSSGRYRQSDPIGLMGGVNTYLYVDGNPVSGVDPLGLANAAPSPFEGPGSIMGGAGGLGGGSAIGAGIGAAAGYGITKLCDSDNNNPQCSMASSYQLIQAGITDEHDFKAGYVGKKHVARYDICACKDGSIKIAGHGQCGKPGSKIDTYEKWK